MNAWLPRCLTKSGPIPSTGAGIGSRKGIPCPRDASDQEVARLFAVIDLARDAAMFGLIVGAGLHVEEVALLRLPDLCVPQSPDQLAQLRVRGKGERRRMVWVTPLWYAKVATWLAMRPAGGDDHLFLNQHGRGLTKDGIQYWLKRYTATASITVTYHQLRHTFARRLADQRMPIESISKLFGTCLCRHHATLYPGCQS